MREIVEAPHARISRESVANQTLVVQVGAPSVAYQLKDDYHTACLRAGKILL